MESFDSIVRSRSNLVFRTLSRLCGRDAGLEDLSQEVFLRLYRALPHFRGESGLDTYLHRIVVNVAKDEWARRRRMRRVVSLDDPDSAWPDQLTMPGDGPADSAQQNSLLAALDAGMARLDFEDRAILVLFFQEERTYKEIAAILDLPIGTVKTNLFRAKQKLRDTVKEWISPCTKASRTAGA